MIADNPTASAAAAIDNRNVLAADETTDDGASVSGESLASSTASVSSSVLDYRIENGRTYHKYKDGKYFAPNDDREKDRLDLMHNQFLLSLDDRLGTAPPNQPDAEVGRVLDVGTGTGIWAMDFGDEHPGAEIIGVDLSATQSTFVPPNVRFEIDDIEEPWTFSEPFDYIHVRMMKGSIRDWKTFFQRCFDNLSPGGYIELSDLDILPVADDDTLTEDTSLMKAFRLFCDALAKMGVAFETADGFKNMIEEVGFEDVHVKPFKWPTNGWAKDPKHRLLGSWNYDNLAPNLDGLLMAPLTRAFDWEKAEVHVLAMETRKDLGNRNIHAYFNVLVNILAPFFPSTSTAFPVPLPLSDVFL
ncbi:putative methyltransferase domain-containing protein [Colletotrichum karsti]|uniref:Methyltransferase domain-containing protein n=1 Tax=Colletotrichum karsti TaxID=1095194 RepID=A0A9P6IF25_9PEZI|nr:putative methyltransferase domain-containing protein [Colletotrichum karsti]KAF9881227.1 putative methyltransferase domain-containing protein [Colletotrichum karsti]